MTWHRQREEAYKGSHRSLEFGLTPNRIVLFIFNIYCMKLFSKGAPARRLSGVGKSARWGHSFSLRKQARVKSVFASIDGCDLGVYHVNGVTINIADPQDVILADNLSEIATTLRFHYDARFAEPLKSASDRFVWDYWHVPGQYTLLRTPADQFFPPDIYDRLEDRLIEFGERVLGCRGISPIWLSYYVDGCRQELHSDAPHGPWAFVLSLTNWEERRFTGGETVLLSDQVLDFWRNFDPSKGLETPQLTKCIEPHFGRLAVFDARKPHGVRPLQGVWDPREGRAVLHGWFTWPSPFFNGSLTEEETTPVLNMVLEECYAALAQMAPVVGVVTLRLVAGPSGRVSIVEILSNTLMPRPQFCENVAEAREEVLRCICKHVTSAVFPDADGPTEITLPFIFE